MIAALTALALFTLGAAFTLIGGIIPVAACALFVLLVR